MKPFTAAIIGSGNLAGSLAPALVKSGIKISEIFSRNSTSGKKLAKQTGSVFKKTDKFLDTSASVIFLAVKDDTISEISAKIPADKILIHCSGSLPLSILDNYKGETAVFYPVQTFSSHEIISWKGLPVCIESNGKNAASLIRHIAGKLGCKIYRINSDQRLYIHLAAVFANNFSNRMFAIAEEILAKKKIDPSVIKPLILQTALNVQRHQASEVQTGPASRNDQNVLSIHHTLLKNDKELLKIYRLISNIIPTRK